MLPRSTSTLPQTFFETLLIGLSLIWSFIVLTFASTWGLNLLAIVLAEILLYLIIKAVQFFTHRQPSKNNFFILPQTPFQIYEKYTLELIFLGLIIFQLVGAAGGFRSPAILLAFLYLIPLVFIATPAAAVISLILLIVYLFLITPYSLFTSPDFPRNLLNPNFLLSSELVLTFTFILIFILLTYLKKQNLIIWLRNYSLAAEKTKVAAYNHKAELQQGNIFELINNQKNQSENFRAALENYLIPQIQNLILQCQKKSVTKQEIQRDLAQIELQLKKVSAQLFPPEKSNSAKSQVPNQVHTPAKQQPDKSPWGEKSLISPEVSSESPTQNRNFKLKIEDL